MLGLAEGRPLSSQKTIGKSDRLLAQLFKRLSWAEIRACSVNDAEAYEIRDAVAKGQRLLAEAGVNPR